MNNNIKEEGKIIIVDLEATCWENNRDYQKKHSEIIEIGICILDIETGNIMDNRGILIKPEDSKVSPFCERLTTISQMMLDTEGIYLKEAISILMKEYNSKNYMWASYGAYDKTMMLKQCESKSIDYPFQCNHINVKDAFKKIANLNKSVGMKKALSILNIPLDGTHHRGIDDARNIAKILYWTLMQD